MFEVESFPGISNDDLFALAVACFLSDQDFQQAIAQINQDYSYAEALSQLVEYAQSKMRKYSCCLTIPTGHVLAYPPNRPPESLAYVTFSLFDIVRAAFPPPPGTKEEASVQDTTTLWGVAAPTRPRKRRRSQDRSPSSGRIRFVLVRLGQKADEEGWEARAQGKALGLAYSFTPLIAYKGYQIHLWHHSGKKLASVYLWGDEHEDHHQARTWVKACLQLPGDVFPEPTDWLRAYPIIIRQQPVEKKKTKREVLTQRLEALWQEQQRQPRQVPLFS